MTRSSEKTAVDKLPEPYYSDDHVTIYHGDALEVRHWLRGQVLVTDPPYGQAYTDRRGRRILGDGTTAARDRALAEWGSSRPALVFGSWKAARPDDVRQVLIWHKLEVGYQGDCEIPWANTHEEIYVMGKPWHGERCPSVIPWKAYQASGGGRPDHPSPKPLGLMRHLLSFCAPGVIVDPFMGSGSTLRAAKDLGRKAIGVELDERYCEMAAERCAQEVLAL